MVYEWDVKRARRSRVTKRGMAIFMVLAAVAVPIWVIVDFGLLG
jgi:hypothetical protein